MNNNLKDLRKSAGFTQEELAKAAGVSKNYISQLERGTRSVDRMQINTIQSICSALNCSPDALYTESTDVKMYSYWGTEVYFKTDAELSAMDPIDLFEYMIYIEKLAEGRSNPDMHLVIKLFNNKVDRSDLEGLLNNLVEYSLRIVPIVKTWDVIPPIKDAETLKQHAIKTHVTLTKQHRIKGREKEGMFTFTIFERDYDGYPYKYFSRG